MSNYIPGGQKKDKLAAKRERTLIGAVKRGESEERMLLLAEKFRQAKVQACRAHPNERITSMENWESITPQEILRKYMKYCEPSADANGEDAAAEP